MSPSPHKPGRYTDQQNNLLCEKEKYGIINILKLLAFSTFSGLLGGLVGPWITNKFTLQRWKETKNHELKYEAFKIGLRAIGKLEADILNIELQNKNISFENTKPLVNFLPDTRQEIENAKGLIKTWFSNEIYEIFEKVLRTNLSLKNVSCGEHEDLKNLFIIEAAKEIKIK